VAKPALSRPLRSASHYARGLNIYEDDQGGSGRRSGIMEMLVWSCRRRRYGILHRRSFNSLVDGCARCPRRLQMALKSEVGLGLVRCTLHYVKGAAGRRSGILSDLTSVAQTTRPRTGTSHAPGPHLSHILDISSSHPVQYSLSCVIPPSVQARTNYPPTHHVHTSPHAHGRQEAHPSSCPASNERKETHPRRRPTANERKETHSRRRAAPDATRRLQTSPDQQHRDQDRLRDSPSAREQRRLQSPGRQQTCGVRCCGSGAEHGELDQPHSAE